MVEKEARTSERFELMSHSEQVIKQLGMECVKYHKFWKDRGAPATQYAKLVTVAQGLVCIHPESRKHLVEISYSTRNDLGVVPDEAKHEGERFIESLQAQVTGDAQ